MDESTIRVQVVYARAERRIRCEVLLPPGATVKEAIDVSGIVEMIPAGSIDALHLGVFGRKVTPDQPVEEGDRIEIYRPLRIDPMDARRRRAR